MSDGANDRLDHRVEDLTRQLREIRALCLAVLPERQNARETVDLVRDVVGSLRACIRMLATNERGEKA